MPVVPTRAVDDVAGGLAEALNGHPDTDLTGMTFGVGETYLMLLGPHGETGWCWCQATMEDCPNKILGETHQHPHHRVRPN